MLSLKSFSLNFYCTFKKTQGVIPTNRLSLKVWKNVKLLCHNETLDNKEKEIGSGLWLGNIKKKRSVLAAFTLKRCRYPVSTS